MKIEAHYRRRRRSTSGKEEVEA
jgi:hypothetical protein